MHKIKILTFGFKFGHPNANYYFDVSFLKNPVRESGAKLSDKFNESMLEFVKNQPSANLVVGVILDLLKILRNEHADAIIGIGCNSGKHRSRAVAKMLKEGLDQLHIDCEIEHRDN